MQIADYCNFNCPVIWWSCFHTNILLFWKYFWKFNKIFFFNDFRYRAARVVRSLRRSRHVRASSLRATVCKETTQRTGPPTPLPPGMLCRYTVNIKSSTSHHRMRTIWAYRILFCHPWQISVCFENISGQLDVRCVLRHSPDFISTILPVHIFSNCHVDATEI